MILGGGKYAELLSVALKNLIPKQNKINMFWLSTLKLTSCAAALTLYSLPSASLATLPGQQKVFSFSKSNYHCCLLLCMKQEPWSLTHLCCGEWWLKDFKNTVQPTSQFTTLLESKWELKALQTVWLGWWVTPLELELYVLMCDKLYCALLLQGGVNHAIAWLMVCVSSRSAESLVELSLLQSSLSLANLGLQQSGEETGLSSITLPQCPSPQAHGNSSWTMWLIRVSRRLSESHPESKCTDAAFKLCKGCILKWSRSHQAINLLLKLWQC